MQVRKLLAKAKIILSEEGFLSLIRKSVWSSSTVDLWANNLNNFCIDYQKPEGLELKIISSVENFDKLFDGVMDISWYDLDAHQCRARLRKGAILFCVINEEEIAYISWAGTNQKSSKGFYSFPLYKYDICIGGTMTSPKYRGKGIHKWASYMQYHYLKEKVGLRALLQINKDNNIAQKAQIMLGSRIWGEGHHLRLLPFLNFYWVKPVRYQS